MSSRSIKEPLVGWPFADVDVFVDDCLGSLARSLIPLGAILKGHPQNLQDFELPPTLSTFSKSYTYSSKSMQLFFLFHCISLPQLKAVKTWRHFAVAWKIDLRGRGKGKRGRRLRDALINNHPGSSWRSKAKRAGNVVRRQALPSVEAAKQGKQQWLFDFTHWLKSYDWNQAITLVYPGQRPQH